MQGYFEVVIYIFYEIREKDILNPKPKSPHQTVQASKNSGKSLLRDPRLLSRPSLFHRSL